MNPRTDLLPVTQADKDIVSDWWNNWRCCAGEYAALVQAFAAHRLAHTPETQIGRDGLATQADIVLVSDEFGEGGYQLHGLFYTFEDAMAHVRKDAALPDEALWDTELADKCEIVDGDVRWTAVRQPMRFGLDHPNVLDEAERVARALAKADGLDWDETCALECPHTPGVDGCDSSTCVAALDEDHDPDVAREHYLKHARAALAAIPADPLRARLVEAWNALMDSTSMLSFNAEVAAWARKNVPALLAELTPESE